MIASVNIKSVVNQNISPTLIETHGSLLKRWRRGEKVGYHVDFVSRFYFVQCGYLEVLDSLHTYNFDSCNFDSLGGGALKRQA